MSASLRRTTEGPIHWYDAEIGGVSVEVRHFGRRDHWQVFVIVDGVPQPVTVGSELWRDAVAECQNLKVT